jgi:DNA polymerase-1
MDYTLPFDPPVGRQIVSDVETNGLLPWMKSTLPSMDRVHCATARDLRTGEHFEWTPDNIKHYPEWMMDEVGLVFGHNFLGFDQEAIRFVYPSYRPEKMLTLDTLIMCKMIWPADTLIGPDMKLFHAGKMPAKFIKRQSLGAWGCRLGNNKGEYDGGWDVWSEVMQEYMVQDENVNVDLVELIFRRLGWLTTEKPAEYVWPYKPFWIEHEFAKVITAQENIGVAFDSPAAMDLVADLTNRKAAMGADLIKIFGSWYAPKDDPIKGRVSKKDRTRKCNEHPDVTIPRVGKTGKPLAPYVGPPKEYTFADSPYCRIEYTEFNPNSRTHLGDRLMRLFNWVPNVYNPNGKPQVDEGAIKSIPRGIITEETRTTLLDYFVVAKTLGQINDGKKAWMAYVADDGAIHGRVDPLGTISSRGVHFNPNQGQTPAVRKADDGSVLLGVRGGFGFECRSLFRARRKGELSGTTLLTEDWELTGSDMSSLEFIWLGHYLKPLDEGVFSERVCDPERDAHTEHGELTGLGRAPTKTVGYAYIFGAGKWKIGDEVGVSDEEIPELLTNKSMKATLRWMEKVQGTAYKEPSDLDKAKIAKGSIVIAKFEGAITGLKFLKEDIKESAGRGWIKAIDGRKLTIRKAHAALNQILQGGGAISCKVWIILFHQKMREVGYVLGVDYNQVLWVHDEIQVEHKPGLGPLVSRLSNEAAHEAGEFLGLRGELRTEAKTGRNWAETH